MTRGKFSAKIDNARQTADAISARATGDCKWGNRKLAMVDANALAVTRITSAIEQSVTNAEETYRRPISRASFACARPSALVRLAPRPKSVMLRNVRTV